MLDKKTVRNARLAYIRLSQIFEGDNATNYPTDDSFITFYRILLSKLGFKEEGLHH